MKIYSTFRILNFTRVAYLLSLMVLSFFNDTYYYLIVLSFTGFIQSTLVSYCQAGSIWFLQGMFYSNFIRMLSGLFLLVFVLTTKDARKHVKAKWVKITLLNGFDHREPLDLLPIILFLDDPLNLFNHNSTCHFFMYYYPSFLWFIYRYSHIKTGLWHSESTTIRSTSN